VASGFGNTADMTMNMALTSQQVGVPILKALGRTSTVLPGFLTKFLVGALRTVPLGQSQDYGKSNGAMTAHQR